MNNFSPSRLPLMLRGWSDRPGELTRQAAPALADLVSQGIPKGGFAVRGGGERSGHERCFSRRMRRPPMPAGSACHSSPCRFPPNAEIFPGRPTSFSTGCQRGACGGSGRQEQAPVVCLDFWCGRQEAAPKQAEEVGDRPLPWHMVFKGSGQLAPGEFDRRNRGPRGIAATPATGFDDVH